MNLTIGEAKEFVRARLDELSVETSDMLLNNIDDQNLDNSIEKLIEDAITYVHLAAPAVLMEGLILSESSFQPSGISVRYRMLEIDTAALTPEADTDILRLVSFQCGDSDIKLTTAFHEDTPQAHMQLNEYIQGQPDSPVLVQMDDSPNFRPHFKYYTTNMTHDEGDDNLHFVLRFFPRPRRLMAEGAISVSPASLIFPNSGGSKTVTVTTESDWSIPEGSIPSWITISPSTSGEGTTELTLTASSNTGSEKGANLIFETESSSATLELTQRAGIVESIEVQEQTLSAPSAGGTVTTHVRSSGAWMLSAYYSKPSWITAVNPDRGEASTLYTAVNFTVAEIPASLTERSTTLRFELTGNSDIYRDITITQSAQLRLAMSPESLSFNPFGETKQIMINSNVSWEISKPSWLSIVSEQLSGTGNATISVVASRNDAANQSGNITVSGSGLTDSCLVTQNLAIDEIQLDVYNTEANKFGASGSVGVKSTGAWQAVSQDAWITNISPATGDAVSNFRRISFVVNANNGNTQRTGHIKFSITDLPDGHEPVEALFTIVQNGQTSAGDSIKIENHDGFNNYETIEADVDFIYPDITASGPWTVTSDQNWIREFTSGSWQGSVVTRGPLLCAVDPNEGETRQAILTARLNSNPTNIFATYTVTQLGSEEGTIFFISPSGDTPVDAGSTSTTIDVTSNTSWRLAAGDGVTLDGSYRAIGSGNRSVLMEYDANYSADEKHNTVTGLTTLGTAIAVELDIIQAGVAPSDDYISISPQNLEMLYKGDEDVISLDATADWEVINNYDWVDVSESSGNSCIGKQITITVTRNRGNMRTADIIFRLVGKLKQAILHILQGNTPAQLGIYPTSYTFPKSGGYFDITVDAQNDWQIVSAPTWVTLSRIEGGPTDSVVRVRASSNDNGDYRMGEAITFMYVDESSRVSCFVSQEEGDKISLQPTDFIHISSTGATRDLVITTNGGWSLKDKPDWITLSKTQGVASETISVTIAPYEVPGKSRSGNITISNGTAEAQCYVSQVPAEAPDLFVTPSSVDITKDAQQVVFTINSEAHWSVARESSDITWITLSRVVGEASDTTMTATFTANPRAEERTTYLRFAAEAGAAINEVIVPVRQAGETNFVPNKLDDSWIHAVAENGDAAASFPLSATTFIALKSKNDAQEISMQANISGNGINPTGLLAQLAVYDLGSGIPTSFDDSASLYEIYDTYITASGGGFIWFDRCAVPGNYFGNEEIAIALRVQSGSTYYYAKMNEAEPTFSTSFVYQKI